MSGDRYANRRLDLGELITLADSATPWRCEGVAADGYLTVLTGRGGEGKSLLTLGLAGGVLRGEPVAGINCTQGRVVIFDAENGPKLIGRRLKATGVAHHGLEVYEADSLDLDVDSAWIRDQVAGAQLVVFDSLRTLSPGARENEGDDMAPRMVQLRRLSRQTGAAIIVIHHRGRDDGRDYRGSSVIHDQADLMVVLERDAKDPDRRWRRCLRSAKCRIDAEPPPRWVGIRHHRGGITFTDAAPYDPGRSTPRRNKLQAQVLEVLERNGSATRADVARALSREPSNGTLRRAFDDLEAAGRIHQHDKHWTVATPEMATTPPATTHNTSSDGQAHPATSHLASVAAQPLAKLPPPYRGGNGWQPATGGDAA